jgi:hypothetical protein
LDDPGDTHRFIIRFKSADLRVISVVDGMDSSNRPSKVCVAVNGLMNDVYLDDVLQRTMRGISTEEMARSTQRLQTVEGLRGVSA